MFITFLPNILIISSYFNVWRGDLAEKNTRRKVKVTS